MESHDPYLGVWLLLVLIAGLAMARPTLRFDLFTRAYARLLGVRWKLATFVLTLTAFVALAPLSGVPTWDPVNATFMSVLAFTTAPWSVATVYRWWRGKRRLIHAYTAVVVGLFSASWSYDFYLLMRDGDYPTTWLANLVASSILYVCAGLMWNLDWTDERGVHFGFTREDWPNVRSPRFRRLGPWIAAIALLAALVVGLYALTRAPG